MKVALLAGLDQPVLPAANDPETLVAFELADAFREWRERTPGAAVDLFARKGSWGGLPLVTVNPDELDQQAGLPVPLAVQEALYTQLALGGMLNGYDIIHSLAPVVTVIQLAA